MFTNPTSICNGNNNRNIPQPTLTLQVIGSNQRQNIQQNVGPKIANQLCLHELNGQNIGHNVGQQLGSNIASLASALQQQNNLQSLTQQLSNTASTAATAGYTTPTRQTITLLDPATTAAFKAFLTSKTAQNADQTPTLPGQTRLPISSLPISFINKCQNTPDVGVLSVQNPQQTLTNVQSQANLAPAQNSLTPLQGQVSVQTLLSVLSNLQNQQTAPTTSQNTLPVPVNGHTQSPQQLPIQNQNVAPTVYPSPAPHALTDHSFVLGPQNPPQLGPIQSASPTMMPGPPSQPYTPPPPIQPTESPIQSANTNLQKLLPLLFDLVKGNECECRSCTCPCHTNINHPVQPHVQSGYANQINYGSADKTEMVEKESEVFESLGSLRDRLKLWKAKNDSSSNSEDKTAKSDTDSKEE